MNAGQPDVLAELGGLIGLVWSEEGAACGHSAPEIASRAQVPPTTAWAVEHGEPDVAWAAHLTLAMDIRMASTKARIGFVFGRIGITPEAASSWFLPRLVGLQQALEWIYAADILTADEALAGGLLRSVHQPDELVPAAHELARKFVKDRSPVALGLAKQLLYRHAGSAEPLEAHLSDSLAIFWTSIADGKEGVAAFREKRPPKFISRASELPRIY